MGSEGIPRNFFGPGALAAEIIFWLCSLGKLFYLFFFADQRIGIVTHIIRISREIKVFFFLKKCNQKQFWMLIFITFIRKCQEIFWPSDIQKEFSKHILKLLLIFGYTQNLLNLLTRNI